MVCMSLSRSVASGLGTPETLIRAAYQPTNYVCITSSLQDRPDNLALAHETGKRSCV